MQSHWDEKESEEMFSYTPDKAFKELEAEAVTLQQRRTQLDDQRAFPASPGLRKYQDILHRGYLRQRYMCDSARIWVFRQSGVALPQSG